MAQGNSNRHRSAASARIVLASVTIASAFLASAAFMAFRYVSIALNQGEGDRYSHYMNGGTYGGSRPELLPSEWGLLISTPASGEGDIVRIDLDDNTAYAILPLPDYQGDLDISPSGALVAFVDERGDGEQVRVLRWPDLTEFQSTGGNRTYHGPTFLNDSTIVFGATERDSASRSMSTSEIFSLDVTSGEVSQLTSNRSSVEREICRRSDDEFFYVDGIGDIRLFNIVDRTSHPLTSGTSPAYDSDNDRLYFLRWKEYRATIWELDLASGEEQCIVPEKSYKSYLRFSREHGFLTFMDDPDGRGTGYFVILQPNGSIYARVDVGRLAVKAR